MCCKLGHGGCASIDGFAKGLEFLKSNVPLASEDIACELAAVGGDGKIGVGGEDAEVVEVVSGTTVVSVRVLEFAEVVEVSTTRNVRGEAGKRP